MRELILVVDDDRDIRINIKDILEDEGFAVVTADNGLSALDYLRSPAARPSLILLDLMMPKMDGWGFRAAQQNDQQLKEIPVVVLTAGGTRTRAIDVEDILRKPFELDALIGLVEQRLRPPA